jgi:hypothetical protein
MARIDRAGLVYVASFVNLVLQQLDIGQTAGRQFFRLPCQVPHQCSVFRLQFLRDLSAEFSMLDDHPFPVNLYSVVQRKILELNVRKVSKMKTIMKVDEFLYV